jgi:superfamily I DNA/RNA helicase
VPLLDEDYLILSTIHSAKGQEWRSVFILNAIDGCIPSDLSTGDTAEIEEERRLLYVGMTRAKDHLHLILPQRFFAHQQKSSGDRHSIQAVLAEKSSVSRVLSSEDGHQGGFFRSAFDADDISSPEHRRCQAI